MFEVGQRVLIDKTGAVGTITKVEIEIPRANYIDYRYTVMWFDNVSGQYFEAQCKANELFRQPELFEDDDNSAFTAWLEKRK